MPTGVPNFSFLARLILEILRSQNKEGAADPQRPLVDKFLYGPLVFVNTYGCTNFQCSISVTFWDRERHPKI